MSRSEQSRQYAGENPDLDSGLDALRASQSFRGPVEGLDGHDCNDHFAQIYETSEEKFEAAVPFVRHGLDRDERVMYVVDESTETEVRTALRDGGIDVDAALDSGALSFHTVQETYLRNDSFDVEEMIEFYGDTVEEATDEHTALRIVAEMTWIADDDTSIEQIMEYEQRINELFDRTDSLAICQYNRDLFDPAAIRNVVQTHPHLIYDGAVCHNFYYTPPEEFFGEDMPANENSRMLRTLRDRAATKAELQQRERFLQELYAITADSTRSFEEKIHRLLELGTERFDLDIGYFTRTAPDDTFEVLEMVGDYDLLEPGAMTSLSDTYCEKLLASTEPVSVRDAAEAGWTGDRAYETYGLDAYFATTVHVGGEEYGTLCFASETPREESFSDAERTFLDLMGQWIDAELERDRRERFLRESYGITSDPALGFEGKLDAMFDLGCEMFGLELGAMAMVDADEDMFEVEHVSDDHEHFEPGLELPLSETYCKTATDCGGVGSVDDPVEAGYDDLYVHKEFDIKAYLGTHIEVEGDVNRTFFFISEESQDGAFSDDERTFQQLMGQWVKYELERQRQEQFLGESYEITSDPGLGFDEKLERLLNLGCEQMGLEMAGLTHLPEWDGQFRNEYTVGYGEHADGQLWTDPSEGCYCRQAITEDEPVGMADVRGTDWEDDEIHREHGLSSYLGTKVTSGSTPYGTLWVGSTEPRDREFSESEKTFLKLMGQWVSYEIERREHSEAQRDLYKITAAADLSFDEKLDALFELGCEQFGMEIGGLAKVDPDTDYFEVEVVSDDHDHLVPGAQADLSDTYCRVATDHTSEDTGVEPVAVTDPVGDGFEDEMCYEEFGVRAYLGSYIEFSEAPDRTFWFVSDTEREDEFSEAERTFHNLMTKWVQYELERQQREADLRQTKNRFETVFEDSDDSIFIIDPNGDELVDANPAAAEMTGFTREELLSQKPSDLHPDEIEQFRAFLNEAQETGSAWSEDFHCRHKDGRDVPAEITASVITLDGRDLVLALVRDIEERKKHQRYQRKLYEITADPELSTDEKMGQLLELGCERLGLGIGMVTNEHGQSFEIEKMHGSHPELSEGVLTPEMTDNYCRRVVSTGESVSVPDAGHAGWDGDALYHQFDLQCYAGVEVTVGDDTYGTICFSDLNPRENEFTDSEQAFLELMAQQVSYELERKQRESRLTALNDLSRDLIEARDGSAISESVVDIAMDQLDLPVTVIAEYDESDGALQPTAYTEGAAPIVETSSLLDVGDGIAWDAFVQQEQRRERTPLDDFDVDPHPPISEVVACPIGRRGVVIAGSTATDGMSTTDIELVETVAATARSAFDRADREQQLEEREQTLETQNETLERLDRVNDIIRSIDQALVQASTHAEIESVVCERLANAGPYELAWVGGHDQVTGEITPRESAGAEKGYLDGLSIATGDGDGPDRPPARAVQSRELQVTNDVLSDDTSATWRQDALNRGYHALISLPLVYHDKCYGVLNVYAGQPGVFDELEQSVLAELSDTIAYAMNAVESKKALVSNTVTELEFAIEDGDLCMPTIATEAGCTFTLEKIVPASNGGLRTFFTTRGAESDSVLSLEDDISLDAIELVSEREEDGETVCLFTAELGSESFAAVVLEHGGRLSHARAVGNEATMTVELAADAAIREFVEMFQTRYPALTLVAQRTEDRGSQTTEEFHAAITEELTPRQLEAIQTAYFSGFFERPRPRTGSEIADAMDISQPTFNGHLRTAQRKLCRRLFDGEPV